MAPAPAKTAAKSAKPAAAPAAAKPRASKAKAGQFRVVPVTNYQQKYEDLSKTTLSRVGKPTPLQVPCRHNPHPPLPRVISLRSPCAPLCDHRRPAHPPAATHLQRFYDGLLPPHCPLTLPSQGQQLKVVDKAMVGKPGFNAQGQPASPGAPVPSPVHVRACASGPFRTVVRRCKLATHLSIARAPSP